MVEMEPIPVPIETPHSCLSNPGWESSLECSRASLAASMARWINRGGCVVGLSGSSGWGFTSPPTNEGEGEREPERWPAMFVMPDLLARRLLHVVRRSGPRGVTAPRPVITTRRGRFAIIL
mgnify:CR=1 FL=1